MVKLIKEIDPSIQIYVNSVGTTKQEVEDIAPYVDIWCPSLYDYLNRPPLDSNVTVHGEWSSSEGTG